MHRMQNKHAVRYSQKNWSPSCSSFVTNGLIRGKPPAAPCKSVYHCLSYTWFLGMISVGWTIMMATHLPRQMHSACEYRDHVVVYLQSRRARTSAFETLVSRLQILGRDRKKTTKLYQAGRNFLFESNGNCEFPLATSRWPLRSIMYLAAEF